jgi:L-asparaginase
MAIRVVATGGTIASLADPETGAVRPAVGAEDLVRSVPGLDAFGPIAVDEVDRVNGWNVTPATMLEVSRRATAALSEDGVDGVVVTHGTDTVEETAFLCDVTIASDKPVAFAAAMRSGNEIAADGPRNLLNAARVASDPAARGIGAVLVLNDEVHAARWARKQDSYRVSAFTSPGHGPIGSVTPSAARIPVGGARRFTVGVPASLDHAVPVVQTYTGMEEHLIEAVLDATGAAGLVLEGTGLGNVPGSAERGIRAARERGRPVGVATRVPTGGTGAVYGGPGGGVTLREHGVVQAGGLAAAKARLLMLLLLAAGAGADDVGREVERAAQVLAAW